MKGAVNPFEPWRPAEANVPPPLHASRPWRPPPPARVAAVEEPPFAEPVEPPRKKPKEHPPRPKQPRGRTDQRSTASGPVAQLVLLVLPGILFGLGLGCVNWYCNAHVPRLLALGASVSLFAGMALSRRRGWHARLTGMASALALAGFAVWFVPTLHGVSLWSAYRQVEELRSLPAGDVAEYQRGSPVRQMLVREFPTFTADIRTAEQAWLRRTVDEAIETADRRMRKDPHKALADLHQLNEALAPLQSYASVREELQAARQRALQACRKVARR